jgi:hypothetical protein
MSFVRFVLTSRHPDSGVEDGIFGAAYELRDDRNVDVAERARLSDALQWFEEHLRTPERFNRTRSKGFDRRATKGISWFREIATEHVSRMHLLKRILDGHGHAVTIVRESRVGYIVYEDDIQVVAEPFADTRTGSTPSRRPQR